MQDPIERKPALKHSIAWRLIAYVFLLSSIMTLTGTFLELYSEYSGEIRSIDNRISLIEKSYLPSLINVLWIADEDMVNILLAGILHLPDMCHLEIRYPNGPTKVMGKPTNRMIEHKYPLSFTHSDMKIYLGTLYVSVTLDKVYERLENRFLTILGTQGAGIFLVSILLYFLFHMFVGKHIYAMGAYVRTIDLDKVGDPLYLKGKKNREDELDHLVSSINQMKNTIHEELMKRARIERELRENEKRLSESNQLMASILEHTHVMAVFLDQQFNFIWVNRAYADSTRHKPSFFPGKNHFDLYPHEENQAIFQRVVVTGEQFFVAAKPFEFPDQPERGVTYWDWSLIPVKDDTGKVTGLVFTLVEVTERIRAENSLIESEAKYRVMMESMNDPVYICSPDYRVEYMNPSMIKRTGRDATGEYCFKALHDLEEKCPWCIHNKVQQGRNGEFDIVSPKNNRSYHVSHSPIFHEDGSISKMTLFRDTTDFKKMETQLQQAQKMEAIGTLAGGIAHDFNNILFPVSGYTEMLLLDIPDDSPFHHSLSEISAGVKRAVELVTQILTFSRQREHELKPLKVEVVVIEALKLIRSSLPTTIEIMQNVNKDCGLVMADPTQIHQIVMNLCTNAYHAMEETGGKLIVNLKGVELETENLKDPSMISGKYVCLTVADTGSGMKQTIRDRIFDPYFTTKENGKGTGLGLAVVHGIVKSHGGHISVYSEPGKGTEFKVHLPVIKKQEETAKVETDAPIQKGDERILLVDDQDMVVQMEKQMLERLGYHVTTRISSIDALEAFRANPNKFDLVITDMTMPNMTGDKLSAEIMKIRSDIPVILCTGFSEMMSKEKAATLGIKGFLMKPIVIKNLSHIIRDVLDNK